MHGPLRGRNLMLLALKDLADHPPQTRIETIRLITTMPILKYGHAGKLEIRIHSPEQAAADRAAAGWDGDRYRFLDGPAGDALVWISVWDTERDAVEFATGISAALEVRYEDDPAGRGRSVAVTHTAAEGRPVVVVTDSPASAPLPDTGPAFRLAEE